MAHHWIVIQTPLGNLRGNFNRDKPLAQGLWYIEITIQVKDGLTPSKEWALTRDGYVGYQ